MILGAFSQRMSNDNREIKMFVLMKCLKKYLINLKAVVFQDGVFYAVLHNFRHLNLARN